MTNSAINGLLDITRGITTIVSAIITCHTIKNGFDELFKTECDRCNGMGKIVCQKCNGTNILVKRPAQKIPNLQTFNRRQEDLFDCFVCGKTTSFDNNLFNQDENYNDTERIREIVRNAIRNKPVPRNETLAGTEICPSCRGQCSFFLYVPNFTRLLNLNEVWYMKPLRKGFQAYTPPVWPRPHSKYIEWYGRPHRPINEREVGYFGDAIYDYEDHMYKKTKKILEVNSSN